MTPSKNSVAVMGILNVTPDSFYDGGKYDAVDRAFKRAEEIIEEGAEIVDIGGESTGPGSENVSMEEELKRVIPVIRAISDPSRRGRAATDKQLAVIISVDTYKANVAEAALDAGASIINDVTAGRGDPAMLSLVAERECDYIMMRSKNDSARTTIEEVLYEDVLKTIHEFFEERINSALSAGMNRDQLMLDPGLGHFVSSDPTYSWHILENLEFLSDFGCRVLVSPSRKSFTAEYPGQLAAERLPLTLKATEIALKHGASIIRAHDVAETKEVVWKLRA
ncbi:MAG TPA: dihydropteroate synthase [Candidatus Peribacterales bacterium]|nr:dihydropteroate synthase [Candidatus Peribacterales bacterium]